MTDISETAYPRIKGEMTARELARIYGPKPEELRFARSLAKTHEVRFCALVLLKLAQRLGYFPPLASVPARVLNHLEKHLLGKRVTEAKRKEYDRSTQRVRHIARIRTYLSLRVFSDGGEELVRSVAERAADTKEKIPDIINEVLEELVKQRFELPGFTALLRMAQRARAVVNNRCYDALYAAMSPTAKDIIDELLESSGPDSGWNQLNREPKKAKAPEIRSYLQHLQWLTSTAGQMPPVNTISFGRHHQYLLEARSLHVSAARELKLKKRYALAIILIQAQRQKALDGIAEMLSKKVQSLKNSGEQRLRQYHLEQVERTEKLIGRFHAVLETLCAAEDQTDIELREALSTALKGSPEALAAECDEYMAYASNNFWPFTLAIYRNPRALLFSCLEALPLEATSSDQSVIEAIQFIMRHRNSHKEWITLEPDPKGRVRDAPRLEWLPDQSRRLVTGLRSPSAKVTRIHRKYFELFVFVQIQLELKNGDLIVRGSDKYSDYRDEVVSEEEYQAQIGRYGELVGLSTDPRQFVNQLKEQLFAAASRTMNT